MNKEVTIVTKGQGNNLLLNFEWPKGKGVSSVQTGWSMLFQNCHWRFDTQTHSYGSEDSRAPLSQLKLGLLDAATLSTPGQDLELLFSNEIRLLVFCATNNLTSEQWEMSSPTKGNLKVWGNGQAGLNMSSAKLPTAFHTAMPPKPRVN